MNQEIYNTLIHHLFQGYPQQQLKYLGFKKNVYNDSLVIEVAAAGKIRFSFKFKSERLERLECCVNLRPFSENIGEDSSKNIENFKNWVKENYGEDVKLGRGHPYFKPFGCREIQGGRNITKDIFFSLGESYTAEEDKQAIKKCPEFPDASHQQIKINLREAVQRILDRL